MERYEQLKGIHTVLSDLLAFAKAYDERETAKGRGLHTSCEHGDILEASQSRLRLLERIIQDTALEELTRLAQEDGIVYR